MLLTQYDEQAHIEYEKELSFDEGKEEGIKEGKREIVEKMFQKEMPVADICELTGLDAEEVIKYRKGK